MVDPPPTTSCAIFEKRESVSITDDPSWSSRFSFEPKLEALTAALDRNTRALESTAERMPRVNQDGAIVFAEVDKEQPAASDGRPYAGVPEPRRSLTLEAHGALHTLWTKAAVAKGPGYDKKEWNSLADAISKLARS